MLTPKEGGGAGGGGGWGAYKKDVFGEYSYVLEVESQKGFNTV